MKNHGVSRRFNARLLALVVLGVLVAWRPPAEAQATFDEIVQRLAQTNPTLQTFIVEQIVDVRVLFIFRWRVRTTVYAARPASYKVIVHDPPPLLRKVGEVFYGVSSPEHVLADYRAVSIQPTAGNRLRLELAGRHPAVNPPAIDAIVDADRWVVEELLGKYAWGEVRARYRYEEFKEYLLPAAAQVSVSGFAISADLTFTNYLLNVSLPPGTFEGAASGNQ